MSEWKPEDRLPESRIIGSPGPPSKSGCDEGTRERAQHHLVRPFRIEREEGRAYRPRIQTQRAAVYRLDGGWWGATVDRGVDGGW
jgi:hypothetical protein